MTFKVTKEVLKQVQSLASQGLTQDQIALTLGIVPATLYNKKKENVEFMEAIHAGKAKGIATISNALFKSAKAGSVPAQRYYLSTRDRENWAERHEITGANGSPLLGQEPTEEEIEAEMIKRGLI